MREKRLVPKDPLAFIRKCLTEKRVFWTYHVNMRMKKRFIERESILAAADTFEILESYPDDKYLPSYLVLGRYGAQVFHVLIAVDTQEDNVRVVTAYYPDREQWSSDLRRRKER